jgi:serine protease 16
MTRKLVVTLGVILSVTTALPVNLVTKRFYDEHMARLRGDSSLPAPPDQYFSQRLDHFDFKDSQSTTWNQRFWVNASFFKDTENAPVFFYIEGEGAGSPYSVVSGEHVSLAAQYGALIVSLEHRFYGASIPTADYSTSNMYYLSSHQAIADLAAFFTLYLKPTYNLTVKNKVVTYGGSYPGALSAWARLRLPHIVHTALSTSSPVEASIDFTGYNAVVANSLSYPLVGGSSQCLQAMTQAFQAIDAAFTGSDAERHAMATKLMSCTPLDGVNDTMWAASNYASIIMGVVQYNIDGQNLDIRTVCKTMTQPGVAPIDAFAQVVQLQQGTSCLDNSYEDYVAQLNNTVAAPGGGLGLRQWTWQTCVEFAYYQTCEPDTMTCPFSRLMTLESSYKQCQDGFGDVISQDINDYGVAQSNYLYGGNQIKGTRIIFANGNVDPWHYLSVYNQSTMDPRQPAVFIDGTAHCRNMYTPSPNDPEPLVAARGAINAYIADFLSEPL